MWAEPISLSEHRPLDKLTAKRRYGLLRLAEDAWNVANKVLGPAIAAATIALIYDKHLEGQVKSAGGYLQAMVKRTQAGDLYLDRSFYGRLSEARA